MAWVFGDFLVPRSCRMRDMATSNSLEFLHKGVKKVAKQSCKKSCKKSCKRSCKKKLQKKLQKNLQKKMQIAV